MKPADLAAQAAAYFEMSELALVTGDHLSAVANAEAGLKICALSPASDPVADQPGRGHRLLGAALAMEGSDLVGAEDHLRQALGGTAADESSERFVCDVI